MAASEQNVPVHLPEAEAWIESQEFSTTADIKIPEKLADQVIGQDAAVEVIRKAAEQKRHVMLIGEPGTGKSMLARSMTDYLPVGELQDTIVYHNPHDPNEPRIKVVPAGRGKEIVAKQKAEAIFKQGQKNSLMLIVVIFLFMLGVAAWLVTG
ncbi:MAG: ATP-binding protein, partial [Methanomassiliicoccales archaeon]|nr:ATP-binding protein [Methanomassiliicoccales archaeon]